MVYLSCVSAVLPALHLYVLPLTLGLLKHALLEQVLVLYPEYLMLVLQMAMSLPDLLSVALLPTVYLPILVLPLVSIHSALVYLVLLLVFCLSLRSGFGAKASPDSIAKTGSGFAGDAGCVSSTLCPSPPESPDCTSAATGAFSAGACSTGPAAGAGAV